MEPGATNDASSSALARALAEPEFDVDSLHVARDGVIWLGDHEISESQLRVLLRAQGLVVPLPTKATYDTTTENRTGWRFVLTPKWTAALAIAATSVILAAVIVVIALRSVHADFADGNSAASASSLHIVVGTLLYLGTGLVMCVYALREKYDQVNRLDPRTWIRELRRVRRVASRPLTDGEIEDWIIDSHEAAAAAARSSAPPPAQIEDAG